MKKYIFQIIWVLVLASTISWTGCATTTGGGGVTLDDVRTNIDWAMLRYHNRQAFGFLSTGEQDQVAAAYKAYQAAFNQALKAANNNVKAPAPQNVRQLGDNVTRVLASIP